MTEKTVNQRIRDSKVLLNCLNEDIEYLKKQNDDTSKKKLEKALLCMSIQTLKHLSDTNHPHLNSTNPILNFRAKNARFYPKSKHKNELKFHPKSRFSCVLLPTAQVLNAKLPELNIQTPSEGQNRCMTVSSGLTKALVENFDPKSNTKCREFCASVSQINHLKTNAPTCHTVLKMSQCSLPIQTRSKGNVGAMGDPPSKLNKNLKICPFCEKVCKIVLYKGNVSDGEKVCDKCNHSIIANTDIYHCTRTKNCNYDICNNCLVENSLEFQEGKGGMDIREVVRDIQAKRHETQVNSLSKQAKVVAKQVKNLKARHKVILKNISKNALPKNMKNNKSLKTLAGRVLNEVQQENSLQKQLQKVVNQNVDFLEEFIVTSDTFKSQIDTDVLREEQQNDPILSEFIELLKKKGTVKKLTQDILLHLNDLPTHQRKLIVKLKLHKDLLWYLFDNVKTKQQGRRTNMTSYILMTF